jgi:hypothetical protein
MPQTVVLPRQVALISGVVAAGAVLRFYRTGTSTPQSVYTDASLTNAVTSDTADASGVFRKLYYNPNAGFDYRVTLEDAFGVVSYIEDNISRLPVSADDIGAALYPISAAEQSEGLTSDELDKRYYYGDPRRYGSVGDGVADDTEALQVCLRVSDGRTVNIPVGTYLISESLPVYSQNIVGEGSREDVVIVPNGDFACFTNAGHEFIAGSIRRLTIIYNSGVQPSSASGNDNKIGVFFEAVNGRSPNFFEVEDVEVRGAWWAYYDNSGSYACNVSRFFMWNCQNGFRKENGTTFTLNQVIGLNCNKGFYLNNNDDFSLHACANDGAVVTAGGSANEFIGCVSFTITTFDVGGNDIGGNDSTMFSFLDCAGTFMGLSGHANDFSESAGFTSMIKCDDSFITLSGHRHRRSTGLTELTMTGNGTYYSVLAVNGSKVTVVGSEILKPTTASGSPTYNSFHATGTARIQFLGCATDASVGSSAYEQYTEAGEFTATLTGCTTSPTGTVRWRVSDKVVTVQLSAISATSNSTAATLTGTVPAAITPARTQVSAARVTDNTTTAWGIFQIDNVGAITLFPSANGGNFTSSGTKGVDVCSFTYSLD